MADRYHAPTAPDIPSGAVQSLIPRLTTTINDIDSFKNLLGQGAQDGSMPNWETLLQRYSLLLGRINALSTYLAQPAPPPPARPGVPRPPPDTRPALDRFIVHPLNPVPPTANPIAPDAFFQVINTQPLPAVSESQADLLLQAEWPSKEDLRKMGEGEVAGVLRGLKERLDREGRLADKVREMLEKHEEEYDWGMRVGQDDAEEEEEKQVVMVTKKEDEDEDLFGDDDEEVQEVKEVKDSDKEKQPGTAPNPREGWKIADYMRYMDTGLSPSIAS